MNLFARLLKKSREISTFDFKFHLPMSNTLRSFIILILSSLSLISASAQHNNLFVGLRYGAVLPMGEFASHEFGYGGYALLGKSIGAEAAYFITPKLGFGVDISSDILGMAAVYYADDYKLSEPAFSDVQMLSGPYKLSTYMGGAYYKVTLSPKLHSTIKLMGGLFKGRTPDQFFGVNSDLAGKIYFWKTASNASRFSFLTGASFEYNLFDHVSLLLKADFTYAQLAFKYSNGSSGYTDHLNMPVFRLQPGINIIF
jgi:hypothetical protein